jgi:hypothetical protein
MSPPPPHSPSAGRAARLLALLCPLLALLVGGSLRAACSTDDPTNWCIDETAFSAGAAHQDDRFGGALVFGDFNGDGFDDLAVAAPGSSTISGSGGHVSVFFSNGSALRFAGNQSFTQTSLGLIGGTEAGERFGAALAAGDFDDDGFDDLAIGSPGETLLEASPADCAGNSCSSAGAVTVLYGSATGLKLGSPQFLDAGDFTGIFGDGPREFEQLGEALAVGDFSTPPDGVDDLAAGAPFQDTTASDQGVIYLAFGAPGGLTTGVGGYVFGSSGIEPPCAVGPRRLGSALASARFEADGSSELVASAPLCPLGSATGAGAVFFYGPPLLLLSPSLDLEQSDFASAGDGIGDTFGAALALGDFDGDGIDEFAGGAPLKNHGAGNPNNSGRVYVARGTASGPDPANSPDIIGEDEWAGQTPQDGDLFGSALAAGDVTGDGFTDLLSGAPGEGAAGGFLFLKKGSVAGLTTTGNQVISQGFIGGVTEAGDRFGAVLALGDVDGDGILEVAVGVPNEDVGTILDAGMVYVTHFFNAAWVFRDGFEAGNKAAWGGSTP